MSNETNALLALKNAWSGAIAASDRLRELAPALESAAPETDVTSLDLTTYQNAVAAQSIATLALKSLIEEFQRKSTPAT
jgi:hypothetical protein